MFRGQGPFEWEDRNRTWTRSRCSGTDGSVWAHNRRRVPDRRWTQRVCILSSTTLGDRGDVEYGYTVYMKGGDRPHVHVVTTGRANQRGDLLSLKEDDLRVLDYDPQTNTVRMTAEHLPLPI